MVAGEIFYVQFPLTSDINAAVDASRTEPIVDLFPVATFDIILTKIIQIGGNNGVFRNVVLVVAKALS